DGAAHPRMIVAGIEGEPATVQIHLEPGGEIHRRGIAGHADVAEIAGAIARRDIHAAAERDGKMREVAADAAPLGMAFGGRAVTARMMVAEFDAPMHIVADRLHALPATLGVAAQRP